MYARKLLIQSIVLERQSKIALFKRYPGCEAGVTDSSNEAIIEQRMQTGDAWIALLQTVGKD